MVPFEKSINRIGQLLSVTRQSLKDKQELISANEELQSQIDNLTQQNNKLIQDQGELLRLRELYKLDAEYADYPRFVCPGSFPRILGTGTIRL